ncbi:MAG: rhomboid family intramembrane serine protease [Schleiferiaceae bacterium]|nr:rhomboid family intramembrane serine protease [Schleiferiaceae bacterium]
MLTPTALLLLAANVALTAYAFRRQDLFQRLLFQVRPVRQGQWYRLITAGFLHVSWSHLLFNMLSFYFFAGVVEQRLGALGFLLLYTLSLLGGNVLSLALQRQNLSYSAVGASGAVSGVVYAAIVFNPGMKLAFILLPIPFPAWIFGIGFILYSMYGMNRGSDGIGHEAHLGGALSGLLLAIALRPDLAQQHPLTLIYIAVPAAVFLVIRLVKPGLLGMTQPTGRENWDVDDHYRAQRKAREDEFNRILEKIQTEGRASLTEEEERFLNRHAR